MTKQTQDTAKTHRPGYRFGDGAARDYSHYDEYEARMTAAWRAGPDADRDDIHGAGERGQQGAIEGQSCTVSSNPGGDHRFGEEGDAGVMRNVPGYGLICVSNSIKADAVSPKDHAENMRRLYAARDAADSAAWRRG